jgi:hypothetical protein
VLPDVPPLVLPDVPPEVPPLVLSPEVLPLDSPEAPEAPELALAEPPDELDVIPSDEPDPLPDLDEPEEPDTPDDAPAGPAASGPISRTEQSTSPHVSERAAGVQIVAVTAVRTAIVIVEQPTKIAVFMCTPCQPIGCPTRTPAEGRHCDDPGSFGCHAARW